jgi:penicillin-binding protein 1A
MHARPVKPDGPRAPRTSLSAAGWFAVAVFAAFVLVGIAGGVAVVGAYSALATDLPDPQELEDIQFAEETIVFDRTGEVELARFGTERREVATFDELPPILLDATTATEDKTFWDNTGFDPAAIVSSGIDAYPVNARGGSKITHQLDRQPLHDPEHVKYPDRKV